MTHFSIRPATLADRKFVIDGWISSFRVCYTAGIISMASWHDVMWPEIGRILDRDGTVTLVAEDTGGSLLGFICCRPHHSEPWVHYVYTKAGYRKAGAGNLWSGPGIARSLFAAADIDPSRFFVYSCKTPACSRLASKIPLARWNPLVARFDEERQQECTA